MKKGQPDLLNWEKNFKWWIRPRVHRGWWKHRKIHLSWGAENIHGNWQWQYDTMWSTKDRREKDTRTRWEDKGYLGMPKKVWYGADKEELLQRTLGSFTNIKLDRHFTFQKMLVPFEACVQGSNFICQASIGIDEHHLHSKYCGMVFFATAFDRKMNFIHLY